MKEPANWVFEGQRKTRVLRGGWEILGWPQLTLQVEP